MKHYVKKEEYKARVIGFGGQSSIVKGKCTVELEFDERRWIHELLIIDCNEEVILGMDFLNAYKLGWDWNQNCLKTDQAEIHCEMPDEISHVRRIRSVRNYTIPGRSELIIQGEIVGKGWIHEDGVITAQSKFVEKKKVIVAGVLATRQQRIVPVRLLNPLQQEVKGCLKTR